MTPSEYWTSGRGLGHITPRGKAWPEGETFAGFLADLLAGERVIEFGCGIGRLAGCFPASRYIGLDICPQALALARHRFGGHRFELISRDDPLPEGDAILAHTVLLHIPDDELPGTVRRFSAPRVIVSEILGRRWRRAGDPPVFNREEADYTAVFADAGYALTQRIMRPYPHYRDTDLTILEFRHGSIRDASGSARPRSNWIASWRARLLEAGGGREQCRFRHWPGQGVRRQASRDISGVKNGSGRADI